MLSLNHVLKFGTTVLAAFILSACGSSGGGGDNPDNSPVNNHELNQSNQRPFALSVFYRFIVYLFLLIELSQILFFFFGEIAERKLHRI